MNRVPWDYRTFLRASVMVCTVVGLLRSIPAARTDEPKTAFGPGVLTQDIAGSLVIVGGGPLPDNIRDRFVELAGGKRARVVVIPTASERADQPDSLTTFPRFKLLEVASCELLHTRKPDVANDPAFFKPLLGATGVWLCGGDQSRLMAAYHGTAVERELNKLLARGGVIGGTSAGAAVMSQLMICGGNPKAEVGEGFGFLPGVVIDQHFMNRKRMERLMGVLSRYSGCAGIGIDEQTAIVVRGRTLSVLGNANVRVCLSALEQMPQSVQVLKSGEQVDLMALCKSAQTRIRRPSVLEPLPAPAEIALPVLRKGVPRLGND